MDLKQLKTFTRVAETGSLSKASDRLHRAQPALSRQIKLLEAEIGVDLFIRHGRGMQLTEAGQELLHRIDGLVNQIYKSIDHVRGLASEPRGNVAFGIVPTTSYILSARLAARVADELPGVSLRIVEGYGGHLVDWLQRGDIDVAMMYGPGTDFHFRYKEILSEELVLVGPAGALDPEKPVTVQEMSELMLVLPSSPHGLRSVVEAAASKAKVELKVKIEADSFRVLKDLVEVGVGYTVLPLSSIYREQRLHLFSTAPLIEPKVIRDIILALPPGRTDTHATHAVVKLTTAIIAELIKTGEWRATPAADLITAETP
jgi:LysR family nitrogen assimilation transcriptional regulator